MMTGLLCEILHIRSLVLFPFTSAAYIASPPIHPLPPSFYMQELRNPSELQIYIRQLEYYSVKAFYIVSSYCVRS